MLFTLQGTSENQFGYRQISSYRSGVWCKKLCLDTIYKLFLGMKEFRSVFYMRVGIISKLLSIVWAPRELLFIHTRSSNIGGGLFVQHGYSTVIEAESVGENLWINQNVTIGYRGNGHPTIGNNVRIGTGAVVLGGILIGDNVNIGANAIVVEDIPSNCTVCSPKAQIVKYHKTN